MKSSLPGVERPLSAENRVILNSYRQVAEMLGNLLGSNCEALLHSLEDIEHSVVHIVNGQITGRQVGSPITNTALTMLKRIEEDNIDVTGAYFTRSPDGKTMRSITCAVRGLDNSVIGLLCVNINLDAPLHEFMQQLLPPRHNGQSHGTEVFAKNVDDLVRQTVLGVRESVMGNKAISPANKKREIILALLEQGLFELKDAPVIIANILGISKHTVYLHLRKYKATIG